jgi:hypothetical protein
MKKVIFFLTAIAIGFASLAFSPVEKNNSLDNIVRTDVDLLGGRCDTRFNQDASFSKCQETWTETIEAELAMQTNVLDNY